VTNANQWAKYKANASRRHWYTVIRYLRSQPSPQNGPIISGSHRPLNTSGENFHLISQFSVVNSSAPSTKVFSLFNRTSY
jgi:hypothetical protein